MTVVLSTLWRFFARPKITLKSQRMPRRGLSQEPSKNAEEAGISLHLRRSGRVTPRLRRLGPEQPKGAAGGEMALKVERVVNRSLHREKALG